MSASQNEISDIVNIQNILPHCGEYGRIQSLNYIYPSFLSFMDLI